MRRFPPFLLLETGRKCIKVSQQKPNVVKLVEYFINLSKLLYMLSIPNYVFNY